MRVRVDARVVLIEGVGAARQEAAPLIDLVIWVQSDLDQAKQRCLTRERNNPGAEAFWNEWMREELPFLAAQRPWDRADIVVVNNSRLLPDPSLTTAPTTRHVHTKR